LLLGHVTWQGRPPQPDLLQALPLTLTLTEGVNIYTYSGLTSDAGGNFTVNLSALPTGTYTWRVKGPKFLSTSNTFVFTHAVSTPVEMGVQPAGDANNDNLVDIIDFGILYATFGQTCGDLGYDDRADFNGDCVVDSTDFTLLRNNFGRIGDGPFHP